ncbi:3-keto-5-aminohexanoate cleavage protein [Desulfococcaceae bacterium HSG9]|nr:3-keto-5-aminohexanoate cleavage protein [Desulfococcaceae bacterium HSG9]
MPLTINRNVFITCAVTGSGSTQDKSPHVPRSPKAIADSAIDAAKAGAAIVHCHVRNPETGAPSRDPKLYREMTEYIRNADVDCVLNLTAGMGGDMVFGGVENPLPLNEAGSDMAGASERMAHVAECLPEICSLDCGTMNFAEADYVMTNTPGMLRAMGQMMTDLGVKPEIEAFDTGHLWFAKQLVNEGILHSPALIQLCMGVPWGAPDDLNTFMAMVNNVPADWDWSAFSLGRNEMPYVAASVLAGGNVRVGLEDNLFLDKGVLATNAQLVEKAVRMIEGLGAKVIGPDEVRKRLHLTKRSPQKHDEAMIAARTEEIDFSKPIRTLARAIPSDWTDYNEHMNEARYLQAFSEATDRFMEIVGCDKDYIADGNSYFTAETHIRHLDEVNTGARVYVETQCLSGEGKKLHVFNSLCHEDGGLLATGEHLLIHVNLETRRSSLPTRQVAEKLKMVAALHAKLPRSENIGRYIGVPR